MGAVNGRGAISLSAAAGLSGINCHPRWSPDGKMIAFRHVDVSRAKQRAPCRAGFQLWVMDVDGSNVRQIRPEDIPDASLATWSTPVLDWSPDGSRLLAYAGRMDKDGHAFTTDLSGSEVRLLPEVGIDAVYSPDGTRIASSVQEKGTADGQPGVWRRLVITDADGRSPRIVVEQFLPDAGMTSQFPKPEDASYDPHYDWQMNARYWAGPRHPQWSPSGDMIAFLGALPFDPAGGVGEQVDLWLVDLDDGSLLNVTDDDVWQTALRWCK
jgi:Tol biopolymer transport system component